MTPELRKRFDRLLKDVVDELPPQAQAALDHITVIVDDHPDEKLVKEIARDTGEPESDDLLGLHTGHALTEKSIDDTGALPTVIHIFRDPIVEHCGGWDNPNADEEIYEEVRITLLHEIGHHFGLDEDDLDDLGYG